MTQVGVRELRDNLSRYLERVQHGENVVVTDRGRAIARVVPIEGERTIDRLIREGRIVPAASAKRPAPRPVRGGGTVSDLVADQRR
jgi:prevent-host-death family protein